MEYFKDKLFPEIFKSFLGIVSLWIGSSFKKSLNKKDTTFFSFDFSPFVNVALYLLYLVFFLYFGWKAIQFLRAFIFWYVDNLQESYSPPNTQLNSYAMDDFYAIQKHESFVFRVHWGDLNEYTPTYLLDVSDPKCSEKDCYTKLSVKRSYWGFYKYRCPACKKKYLHKYNSSTLKSDLKNIIIAKSERELDTLPF